MNTSMPLGQSAHTKDMGVCVGHQYPQTTCRHQIPTPTTSRPSRLTRTQRPRRTLGLHRQENRHNTHQEDRGCDQTNQSSRPPPRTTPTQTQAHSHQTTTPGARWSLHGNGTLVCDQHAFNCHRRQLHGQRERGHTTHQVSCSNFLCMRDKPLLNG